MEKPLYKFTDSLGTFVSKQAHKIRTLYFPLCNNAPFMSSIAPTLHGDIKTGNNTFLLEPVSRIGLNSSKVSRNFWIYTGAHRAWSATGVSKDDALSKLDECDFEAGLLWQKVTRKNRKIGLKAEITSFVPASGEPLEIMLVTITNVTKKPLACIPCAAIPLYARSANNLRDHRHVTSLLIRTALSRYGITVTPTLLFDETGHHKNTTSYFVWGFDEAHRGPQYLYPSQEEFCGESGDLEAPQAVLENKLPVKAYPSQGKEAMGGLRFRKVTLAPHHARTYIVLMGIAKSKTNIRAIVKKFDTADKIKRACAATQAHWRQKSGEIAIKSRDFEFDNWFRWVAIQPTLRKIFGCSFLPDFDYGRGGRGWRDLWQDALSLLITDAKEARPLLINNFRGVRIDGTNATIIGQKPGEFIADRNNISRVWMDHGAWPVITLLLYIHQTGNLGILLEKTGYFGDRQLSRGKEIDFNWDPDAGNILKTKNKQAYEGTLLEHILVQNLVQFFNVGPHNHIRLEGADWNDGLDMAEKQGESVAFSAMYALNLMTIADAIDTLPQKKIVLLKELTLLLDSIHNPVNYASPRAKQTRLQHYFQKVNSGISGTTSEIAKEKIITDLRNKAAWLSRHIQKTEWLKEGFFNGYYDNGRRRVEGRVNGVLRMTLTGQTFPIMSGTATPAQITSIFHNTKRYLQDKTSGGFRLNTDFGQEQSALGRAFSFIYGEKENGAFFSHMAVMFAYALYSRGFAREGFEVLDSAYRMSVNSGTSKIYPCLPEYFNAQGRGMYSYLTGSASWFVYTMLTQVCGVRGEYGNLVVEPKLTAAQFKATGAFSILSRFAERNIEVRFMNLHKKEYGAYAIAKVTINGRTIDANLNQKRFIITRAQLLNLTDARLNTIELILE